MTELEQALETLQTLKPDEREDFIKRLPSTLQSLCELMRITLEGNNLEQLARDYSLTERRVSQIIAEQRAAFVARKQRRLFQSPTQHQGLPKCSPFYSVILVINS